MRYVNEGPILMHPWVWVVKFKRVRAAQNEAEALIR